MGSPHRLHHDLYRAAKVLADPGNGGTIRPNKDLLICEMVSVGANETRTLANPTKPGIRFVLRMLTDGGDIVVTAENGLNTALETSATFADAGDMLSLISVSKTATTYRWQTCDGQLGAAIASSSSTATATSTSTSTATATSTSTSSSSASISTTGTKTGSASASASKSASATSTKTSTGTSTSTGTATATATGTQ